MRNLLLLIHYIFFFDLGGSDAWEYIIFNEFLNFSTVCYALSFLLRKDKISPLRTNQDYAQARLIFAKEPIEKFLDCCATFLYFPDFKVQKLIAMVQNPVKPKQLLHDLSYYIVVSLYFTFLKSLLNIGRKMIKSLCFILMSSRLPFQTTSHLLFPYLYIIFCKYYLHNRSIKVVLICWNTKYAYFLEWWIEQKGNFVTIDNDVTLWNN